MEKDPSITTEKEHTEAIESSDSNLPNFLKKWEDWVPSLVIGSVSTVLVFLMSYFNILDTLELRMIDFQYKLRGPLSGEHSGHHWPYKERFTDFQEPFTDTNDNGICDYEADELIGDFFSKEECIDYEGTVVETDDLLFCDFPEEVCDGSGLNCEWVSNGKYDKPEPYTDTNGNGMFDGGDGKYIHGQDTFDDANGNSIRDNDLDIVIVEKDDESFRLIPDPWPYGRGKVWATAIKNLVDAGARMIVFDITFDTQDNHTKHAQFYSDANELGVNVVSGDIKFREAMEYAKSNGTDIVLAGKVAYEESRFPPDYVQGPVNKRDGVYIFGDPGNVFSYGLTNYAQDPDGFARRYNVLYQVTGDSSFYYTLAVESALRLQGISSSVKPDIHSDKIVFDDGDSSLELPTPSPNSMNVNFYGPNSNVYETFKSYPLSSILDRGYYDGLKEQQNWMGPYTDQRLFAKMFGTAPDKESPFEDKIVLIGTSMAEDQDFVFSPYTSYMGQTMQMPGVEFHANALQTILHKNYISSSLGNPTGNFKSHGLNFIMIVLFVFATLLIVNKIPPLAGFAILAAELFVWLSFSVGSFLGGDYLWIFTWIFSDISRVGMGSSDLIPIMIPVASFVVPFGINLSYRLFTEGQDKKFLKNTFGTYVSPDLIDIMYESKQAPQLGGDYVFNTCFFSDIASFSSFSEKLEATDLVELLNEYLEAMTNILLENGGTLDKYIGDAIIGIYGSPIPIDDHEYKGCLSICQMNEKLEELRKKWTKEGDRWPEIVHNMRHRIGLNSGQIVAGNMGSSMRMGYTMMGDAVNATARLESGAKQYGIESQVGEHIYEKTKDKFFFRFLDHCRVVGKSDPLVNYELISEIDKVPDSYKKLVPLWDKAIALYKSQDWDEAIAAFEKAEVYEEKYIPRKTNPCLLYIERCKEFKENPPGNDWDGVYNLKTK